MTDYDVNKVEEMIRALTDGTGSSLWNLYHRISGLSTLEFDFEDLEEMDRRFRALSKWEKANVLFGMIPHLTEVSNNLAKAAAREARIADGEKL